MASNVSSTTNKLPAVVQSQTSNSVASGTAASVSNAQSQGAATAQAQQGAEEALRFPLISIPDEASSLDVMNSLVAGMSDPTINKSSAAKLFELHQMIMDVQKAMIQSYVNPSS